MAQIGLEDVEIKIRELRAEIAPVLLEIRVLEETAEGLRRLDRGEPVDGVYSDEVRQILSPGVPCPVCGAKPDD